MLKFSLGIGHMTLYTGIIYVACLKQLITINVLTMYDLKMDGHQPAPSWFWISLVLLIVATIIFYIIVNDDRRDQVNIEKQATFIHSKQIKTLNVMI